jgi:multiple sugar transport system ATP-binding protein
MTVEVAEWLGPDQFAHLGSGSHPGTGLQMPVDDSMKAMIGAVSKRLIVRLDPDYRVSTGEEMEIGIDTARLHLFDPRTGEHLAPA